MVSLPLDNAMRVITEQRALGIDIPQCIRAMVKVKKSLEFQKVQDVFDRDEELSRSLELSGSLLLMDEDEVVAIIC